MCTIAHSTSLLEACQLQQWRPGVSG